MSCPKEPWSGESNNHPQKRQCAAVTSVVKEQGGAAAASHRADPVHVEEGEVAQTDLSKGGGARVQWERVAPTNCHKSPTGQSQAQCPDTDTTCPVFWHFPGRAGAFTPCFCKCTKEALTKRGLPWKHLKLAGAGAGQRLDLCDTDVLPK